MRSSTFRYALVLGFLSAIGVSALDIYLPSLPAISAEFHADAGTVQLSLTAYFLAMAFAQIIYGSVSDMYGRRPPLFVGMIIYVLGAIGCAVSPNIQWLIAMRFVQGLGAGSGAVIARAVVRDLHTGAEAARLMSLLMLVFSVSPILAPVVGSMIVSIGVWRDVFWVMTVVGGVGVGAILFGLEETRSRELRLQSSVMGAVRNYLFLLKDPYYLGIVAIASFGMASYMIYVTNSSFILIEHFGLSPTQYSLAFSANAVAFIGMSQINGRLARRFGLRRVVRTATIAYAVSICALFVSRVSGVDSFAVLTVMLITGFGFLGLVIPSSAVLALEAHGRIAGTASAMMGTFQFVTASLMSGLVTLFVDGTSMPMIGGIAACAAMVLFFSLLTLRPSMAPVLAE